MAGWTIGMLVLLLLCKFPKNCTDLIVRRGIKREANILDECV